MVETIWTKLPAPHAVIETSLRYSSQERNFLLQRPGGETGSFGSIAGAETALTREFGRHVFEIAALLRVSQRLHNYRVWVVEMIWTKLPAPHAGIEPVSGSRVRNGIFCCRDRAAKWANSRRLQEQRPRLPENSAHMSLRLRRYREWSLPCTTTECAWWR